MTLIKEIPSQKTLIVRQIVLQKGKLIDSFTFAGDNFITTRYFGLFENEHFSRIISLFTTSNSIFALKNQRQICRMAILEKHQKKWVWEKLWFLTAKHIVCHTRSN